MAKTLFLVRHGKAEGQEPEAPLTPDGLAHALKLADLLEKAQVHQIVSSPFTRALQSIEPLAKRLGLGIKTDERLIEANLSTINYPDWLDRLRTTFSDFELAFEGGESSRIASERGIAAISDALISSEDPTVIVTHGRLMTLILKHFDSKYGFDEWKNLTAPDVFELTLVDSETTIRRIWNS
jgi:2,3-bisphosphoglycerate-dependent phosphoglycerate mutase